MINLATLYQKLQTYSFIVVAAFLIIALIFLVPTDNGSLPIRAKYPFNSTVEPFHTVAFVIQAGAVTNGIIAILCMDDTLQGICRFILLQLEVLESNYRHCSTKWPRGSLQTKKSRTNATRINCFVPFIPNEVHEVDDLFIKRFKLCIRHHERLMNIVRDVNNVYGIGMFCQLVASISMMVK